MSLLKTVSTPAPGLCAEDKQRLVERLFATTNEKLVPPRRIYAVLDGARDASIARRLQDAPGLRECLYRGVEDPELLAVAPWLVGLDPGDEWTTDLLLDAWGRSWGIFVEAALPPVALYRHLRTFLKAKDEQGRTLIFRYYDPRIWRTYAPTCTADEARVLTGPLLKFYCEDEDPRVLLEFTRGDDGFVRRAIPFDAPLDPPAHAPAP